MRIYRCWFCSSPIYPGHGTLFVRNDCKEFRFCRGKCHKAFKKHRNPRKIKWTKTSRKAFKKELVDDLSQTFERKRNALLKYERESVLNTVVAIPKIDSIKNKRESAFVRKRLIKGIEERKAEDIKLVKTQMHLIEAPDGWFFVSNFTCYLNTAQNQRKRKLSMMESESKSSSEEEETMDISLSALENEVDSNKVNTPTQKSVTAQKKRKILLRA